MIKYDTVLEISVHVTWANGKWSLLIQYSTFSSAIMVPKALHSCCHAGNDQGDWENIRL